MDEVPTAGDAGRHDGGGAETRQEWVQANFTQIFGTSVAELQAQRIDPRQYAREHRAQIRSFAQMQRSRGIAVPDGQSGGSGGPGGNRSSNRRYGHGMGGRYGGGRWGGGAWVAILLVLFVLRFVLVDSFAGGHAAIFWVLGIAGIVLVARIFLFSWLRRRRRDRRR
jgi:hypothetical protein